MSYHRYSVGQGGRVAAGAVDKRCRVHTYEAGRVCVVEGCHTKLSLYNPLPTCACHTASWRSHLPGPAGRAARPEAVVRSCVDELCGREFVTTSAARKYCSDACRMRAWSFRRERKMG